MERWALRTGIAPELQCWQLLSVNILSAKDADLLVARKTPLQSGTPALSYWTHDSRAGDQ